MYAAPFEESEVVGRALAPLLFEVFHASHVGPLPCLNHVHPTLSVWFSEYQIPEVFDMVVDSPACDQFRSFLLI